MNPFDRFREQVLRQLIGALHIPLRDIERILEKPPEGVGADLALPCFFLSARMRKDPRLISSEVVEKIGKAEKGSLISSVRAIGPYVNFYADWDKMKMLVLNSILKKDESYGSAGPDAKAERVMTEFCHANTHKSFHIGHVRNICLGESISRILEFSGRHVTRVNYQGDIGPHVAKCLWAFINLHKKKAPKGVEKGFWLGEVYAEASQKARGNERVEAEIRRINSKLYAGDKEMRKIWKETRDWSLDYYDRIYKDFGVKFRRLYFESEVEKPGKETAKELVKKGIAKKSEGAVVMNFEKDGLGVFVLLTREGNPLYGAKDLGLAKMQVKEFKPDRILHIVGTEQNMYFRQLFRTLELMQPEIAKKEFHVCYELVNLPTGKMSSRAGTIITYDELRKRLLGLAKKTTAKKNPKLKGKKLAKTAGMVALGALKYGMLNVSPEKVIVFDWDRALSFEGNSAPYIQYSHARAASILRKAGKVSIKVKSKVKKARMNGSVLKSEQAAVLMKHLADFPEAVSHAGRDLKPHYIASYAYDLAVKFNDFYEECPVLTAKPKELRDARLGLVRATKIVLRNALNLMGIDAPEKM